MKWQQVVCQSCADLEDGISEEDSSITVHQTVNGIDLLMYLNHFVESSMHLVCVFLALLKRCSAWLQAGWLPFSSTETSLLTFAGEQLLQETQLSPDPINISSQHVLLLINYHSLILQAVRH